MEPERNRVFFQDGDLVLEESLGTGVFRGGARKLAAAVRLLF